MTKEMTTVFNPDRNEDRRFMSEYLLFKGFVEKVVPRMNEDKSIAFCHFQGLKDLVHAYGQDSTEVNLALSLYHKVLARLSQPESVKTTLILTPGISDDSTGFEIASHLHKRLEIPLSMVSAAPHSQDSKPIFENPPVSIKGTTDRFDKCHFSKDICSKATNSCSSHGECVETSSGCWTCACAPSVTTNSANQNKTTHWAGSACQKKDISVPFNLFFLFTLVIIIVLAWAIGLLYSIGDTELPSVLAAGVAPVKRA